MSTVLDLHKLENQAFKSSYQDGLWDIYLGLILSWNYFCDVFFGRVKDSFLRILALCAGFVLIYLLFRILKKVVSDPRLGEVKFGTARKAKLRTMVFIMIAAVLINLVLVILTRWFGSSHGRVFLHASDVWLALGVGAWVSAIIVIIGYFKGFNRLMYYSVLFGGAFIGAILLKAPASFVLAGLPMILIGIFLFIRFLKKYSIPDVDIDE